MTFLPNNFIFKQIVIKVSNILQVFSKIGTMFNLPLLLAINNCMFHNIGFGPMFTMLYSSHVDVRMFSMLYTSHVDARMNHLPEGCVNNQTVPQVNEFYTLCKVAE